MSSSFRTQRCHPRIQGLLGISPGSGPSVAGKRLGTSLVRRAYAGSKTFQMANWRLLAADSVSSFTDQYPFFASSLEKCWDPANWCVISSRVGVWWWHILMALLRSLGSRHMRSLPLCVLEYAKLFTQSVSSYTLRIPPFSTISSRQFLISFLNRIGHFIGACITGCTCGSVTMWYSPWKLSDAVKLIWILFQ